MRSVRIFHSSNLSDTLLLLLTLALIGPGLFACSARPSNTHSGSDEVFRVAFEQHRRNFQVEGQGVVKRILSDDNEGSRHQRFVIELNSGQTLLVAHNIDIAPRIQELQPGDEVMFRGEYEWNPDGGVIHWTHHDPAGRHSAGWLKYGGNTYQ